MSTELPLHYVDPKLASIYDLQNPHAADTNFYLELAGVTKLRILDIGCGTGLLSTALAKRGHTVVGIDPAGAMLDIARSRPQGNRVEWIQGYPSTLEPTACFDLVLMTGHVVQHLLTNDAIAEQLKSIAAQLAPSGRCAFDTRNPNYDWRGKWSMDPKRNFAAPLATPWGDMHHSLTINPTRSDLSRNTIAFEEHYEFANETLHSSSELFFPTYESLRKSLASAGFAKVITNSDWDTEQKLTADDFAGQNHAEMIFVAHKTA